MGKKTVWDLSLEIAGKDTGASAALRQIQRNMADVQDNMKCPPVKSRGFTTCGRITTFNTGGTDERILYWTGCPQGFGFDGGSG
jgi:hypothetical protein